HYDNPLAIAVSPNGRQLYVTGSSYDDYSIVATDAQMVTVAYDAATGQELWSRIWDGRPDATDVGKTITVTPNGRTVIVGGVTTTAERDLDYVTVAYDAAKGREMWAKTATGLRPGGSDVLNGIAMSPRGDLVYVTGESAGVEQYDADYLTIAYDVRNGRVAWQQRFAGIDEGGSDRGRSVAVSPDGSQVYVTGDSYGGRRDGTTQYDYATVAYDARSGAQRWVARYGGPMAGFNYPVAVAASADRVVVTGQSRGATAEDVRDYGTVAYDTATGDEVWRQRYAPPNSDEIALDLAMSPDGTAVFVTGSSTPAVRYTALSEAATVAYRTDDGRALWTSRLDVGAGNAALGRRLAATPDGGVALVGQTTYSADPLKPQSQNIYDALIVRY
ncbi:MAG TPA: PQQ-binding-like beta-propeller repeat protein, partial [Egibacteraceae bacterium]|nr:PQQ-binding-like beta-propeller repeat protein [Egibacteraceae bacterium]